MAVFLPSSLSQFFFHLFASCVFHYYYYIRKVQVLASIQKSCSYVTALCFFFCQSTDPVLPFTGFKFIFMLIEVCYGPFGFIPSSFKGKISIFAISSFSIYNWCHAFNLSQQFREKEFIDRRHRASHCRLFCIVCVYWAALCAAQVLQVLSSFLRVSACAMVVCNDQDRFIHCVFFSLLTSGF